MDANSSALKHPNETQAWKQEKILSYSESFTPFLPPSARLEDTKREDCSCIGGHQKNSVPYHESWLLVALQRSASIHQREIVIYTRLLFTSIGSILSTFKSMYSFPLAPMF